MRKKYFLAIIICQLRWQIMIAKSQYSLSELGRSFHWKKKTLMLPSILRNEGETNALASKSPVNVKNKLPIQSTLNWQ